MKKLFIISLNVLLFFGLVACGEQSTDPIETLRPTSEVTPEPTSTPTPEEILIAEPVIYTGLGDDVIELPDLSDYIVPVFKIEGNAGSRYFGVAAYDESGNQTELLVNTTEPYSGVTIDKSLATSMLEVTATDEWSITVDSLANCRTISEGEILNGSGDEVIWVLSSSKTATITGNAGSNYFGIWEVGGDRTNLLVNTTEPYEGKVMINTDPFILIILSEDEWSIQF